VSLQGTFDTLSVTELFGLLSTAGKTGALRLEAGEHDASVLVRGGRCCAVGAAAGSEAELSARLVDVGFTLARQPEGSFRFSDQEVSEGDASVPFEPAVAEITAMVAAWKDIEATIPSLDARLRLAPELRDEQIVVTAAQWAVLAGLEGRPTVRELVAATGQPLLDVCRRVKDLVDRGAVEVGAVAAPVAAPAPVVEPARSALEEATSRLLDPAEPEPEPELEPVVVREPARVPEPVAVAAVRDDDPSADRSALLRLFSALKE
jgi:hypothetical protein